MKTLVCIEKIGGISGKRIYVRLVYGISKSFTFMNYIRFPEKSNTLFINPSLLESVLNILNNNKNFMCEEDWGYGKIEVGNEYLLAEIEFKDGEITEIKPISLNDGIKYLNEENK